MMTLIVRTFDNSSSALIIMPLKNTVKKEF